jgi:hypothetical protein
MSSETQKYGVEAESEPRHSALEEFSRDERRPAVLLMAGLLIAAVFFAIGMMVGRWSNAALSPGSAAPSVAATKATPSNLTSGSEQTPPPPATVRTNQPSRDAEHRFTVLVATYNTPEDAQPLIKSLEQAGYKDVRTSPPRADDTRPKFSVMVGRYTRDEARDPKLKNPRIVEEK